MLLVLDTCNAGGVNFDISTYQGELKGGISGLFSCVVREQAFETSIDGVIRGLFSYHVEQGLRGSAMGYGRVPDELVDEARSRYLTLIDLFDYAYDRVRTHDQIRTGQHPLLVGTLESDTIIHEVKSQFMR